MVTLSTRRRAVAAILVTLALWPAAQFQLVQVYDVSPWKLFGWAMYCRSSPQVSTEVFSVAGDGRLRLLKPGSLSASARLSLTRYHKRWERLGRLSRPDAAAGLILEEREDIPGLEVVSSSRSLRHGVWELRTERTRFERTAEGVEASSRDVSRRRR